MHLAIIGTGKMGQAIFQWAVDRDIDLTLVSRSAENLRQQEGRFLRKFERNARRAGLTPEQIAAKKASVRFATDLAAVAAADFILECVPEQPELKRATLAAIEAVARPDALILSNTSFISLARLARMLQRPERFCGFHFFYPVMVVPVIEVITWDGVGAGVVDRLLDLTRVLGRQGIVVKDGPGSPLNGILACLYVEGLYLLEEGAVQPDRLDAIARRHFSPGPCEAVDALGIELVLHGLGNYTTRPDGGTTDWLRTDADELPPEQASGRTGFHVPWLFSRLHNEQRLGRKVSRGLFLYEGDRTLNDAPSFYLRAGATPRPLPDDDIELRLFYSVINAALHVLSKGLCSEADLDYGLKEVLLMKDGPIATARARGRETVRREFACLEKTWGSRFRPMMPLEDAGL